MCNHSNQKPIKVSATCEKYAQIQVKFTDLQCSTLSFLTHIHISPHEKVNFERGALHASTGTTQ